jgi:hypothetical protein
LHFGAGAGRAKASRPGAIVEARQYKFICNIFHIHITRKRDTNNDNTYPIEAMTKAFSITLPYMTKSNRNGM